MNRPLPPRFQPSAPKVGRLFAAWAVFCLLLGLGMLGLTVWAVIELVTWVTPR